MFKIHKFIKSVHMNHCDYKKKQENWEIASTLQRIGIWYYNKEHVSATLSSLKKIVVLLCNSKYSLRTLNHY